MTEQEKEPKLILCAGYDDNKGKWEIHFGEISQHYNIVAVVNEKWLAELFIEAYNKVGRK